MNDEERSKIAARKQRFSKSPGNLQFGLLSRGEDRLSKDEVARTRFFNQIKSSFLSTYKSRLSPDMLRLLKQDDQITGKIEDIKRETLATDGLKTIKSDHDTTSMDLRKLREAILALPVDIFSLQVFTFSARVGVVLNHRQTYVPSLSFLCGDLAGVPENLRVEAVSLHIIHQAIMMNNPLTASQDLEKFSSKLPDTDSARLWLLLHCKCTGNYFPLIHVLKTETNPFTKLLLENAIIATFSKTFAVQLEKSYFSLSSTDFPTVSGLPWPTVQPHVHWTTGDELITLRHRARK